MTNSSWPVLRDAAARERGRLPIALHEGLRRPIDEVFMVDPLRAMGSFRQAGFPVEAYLPVLRDAAARKIERLEH